MELSDQWPSAGWEDAFRRQATRETWVIAKRFAETVLSRLDRAGAIVRWEAEDVVQRILAATAAGKLAWVPQTVSLRAHLMDKIRLFGRRARYRHRHADPGKATVEVPLAKVTDDDPLWADKNLHGIDLAHEAMMRDLTGRAVADIRRRAAKDAIALRVLKALIDGASTVTEIADATGLPPIAVRNGWRRLVAFAHHLPDDLRDDVRDTIDLDDDYKRRCRMRRVPTATPTPQRDQGCPGSKKRAERTARTGPPPQGATPARAAAVRADRPWMRWNKVSGRSCSPTSSTTARRPR